MKLSAWVGAIPLLLIVSLPATAQTPSPATTPAAAGSPAARGPGAELEMEHVEVVALIEKSLVALRGSKDDPEAKAGLATALERLRDINGRCDVLAKQHVARAAELAKQAADEQSEARTARGPEAKRAAIAEASAAQRQALKENIVATQLDGSVRRQEEALSELEVAIKEGSADKIRAASAAFSFEIRRVAIALAPAPEKSPVASHQ